MRIVCRTQTLRRSTQWKPTLQTAAASKSTKRIPGNVSNLNAALGVPDPSAFTNPQRNGRKAEPRGARQAPRRAMMYLRRWLLTAQ